jgi:hypothetical protein
MSPYAPFVELPSIKGTRGGLGGPEVPARLLAGVPEDFFKCEALDLARKVLQDHEKWTEREQRQQRDRKERQELMRVVGGKADARGGAGYPTTQSQPATVGSNQVSVEFRLPDGRRPSLPFKLTDSAFDLYGKSYELLTNKERAFFMSLSGPGTPKLKLNEATWSSALSGLGLRAGSSYVLEVSQA